MNLLFFKKIYHLTIYLISFVFLYSCTTNQKKEQTTLQSDQLKKWTRNNPLKVINYCDSVILEQDQAHEIDLATAYFYKGKALNVLNNYTLALENYNDATVLFSKRNDEFYIESLLGKAHVNIRFKNFTTASEEAHEALRLAKEINNKNLMSSTYSALSFLTYSNGDLSQSLNYLQDAVDILKQNNNHKSLSPIYNNLAIIYKNMGAIDQALLYNNKSLEISKSIDDLDGIASSYINLGRLYAFQSSYNEAINYYNKSLDVYKETDIKNSIPHRNLLEVYTLLENHQKAKEHGLQALEIEHKLNNPEVLIRIYNDLVNTSLKLNHFKESQLYKTKLDSIATIVENKRRKERMTMLESQSKLMKNKFELEVARSNTKITRIILVFVILLVVFILIYFFQQFRFIKLNHKRKKEQLELKILRSQMNPHFIFNALAAIQSSVTEGNPIKSASYISRFAKLIRQNFDFTTKDVISLKEDIEALTNYIETQLIRFKDKFDYQIIVDDTIDQESVYIPPLLLQPFVENSIEHGFKNLNKKGLLTISIQNTTNKKLLITITDNGIGYQPKKDHKKHSIDVIKKRLRLLERGDETSFKIENLTTTSGTKVNFKISY